MTERVQFVDFGAPAQFGTYVFRVDIPSVRTEPVRIIEDYGYRGLEDGIPRDDLAWEIQEEVEAQVQALTGLNQEARGLYRDENVFEDADLQMAGYAAALRVLTR